MTTADIVFTAAFGFCMFFAGGYLAERSWKDEVVVRGCAEYDSVTREFTWLESKDGH